MLPGDLNSRDHQAFAELNDGSTARKIALFDSDGNQVNSFGGGTQYTEGDTDATVVGTAIMWEDTSDTMRSVSASKPLPVDIKNTSIAITAASLPLPTGAATSANQSTMITHLATLAGAVSGTEMQVDVLTMPTVTVQATNLDIRDIDKDADDILVFFNTVKDGSGTDYVPLVDSDGHLQVDILSSALPSGAATSAKQDTIIGHLDGVEALLGTIDADTGNISTKIDTLAGAVSGTEMQVDVLTMPTVTVQATNLDIRDLTSASDSVAAVQSGTWNITNISGTVSLPTGAATSAKQDTIIGHIDGLETSNSAIQTAVELLDDSVATLGTTTYTEATTKAIVIGGVRRDADTTLVNTTNEICPFQMDANGRLKVEVFSGETLPVSFTGSTDVATQTTLASLLTSSQLIDDAIFVDDTATHSTGTTKVMGIGAVADPTDAAVNANDIGMPAMNTSRFLKVILQANSGVDIGDVTLTANSGVDIGDVDVASINGFVAHDSPAAGNPLLMAGYASAAAPTDVSGDGDAVRAWRLRNGAAACVLTAAGALIGGDASNGLDVDVTRVSGTVTIAGAVTNAGTFAVQVDGNALTSLQLLDDVVYTDDTSTHSTGSSKGVLFMAAAVPTDTSVNANDIAAVGMTTARAMYVSVQDALPAGTNAIGKLASNTGVTIGAVELAAAQTLATVTTLTGGGVAHDSGDSGNPIKIGYKVETSPKGITVPADGDRTDAYADADGMALVKQNTTNADLISERVSNTDGNSTAFSNFSAVANTRNYVTGFQVFRTDSGTTPIYVDFRDGTAGSILWSAVIPPNGGSNNPAYCGPALFKTTANTALAFDVSAATTTVYISVTGYQSKV